jgi:hypothetical protein
MSISENSIDATTPNGFDVSQVNSIAEESELSNQRDSNLNSSLIPDDVWDNRIQDKGKLFHDLGNKCYQRNKILGVGPGENKTYYYGLTAIAVDFAKILRTAKDLGTGWEKAPKNTTQIKEKIVERIISLRKQREDGAYFLDQCTFVHMFQSVWGSNSVDQTPCPNDRIRIFGIMMTIPTFKPHFQRLCDGITTRAQLDSSELSINQIYVDLALAFNNEEIVINLPEDAYDLKNISLLNPNDESRISIERDRKYLYLFLNIFSNLLKQFSFKNIQIYGQNTYGILH